MRASRPVREALGLQFVRKLAELVEIDARTETERMRPGPGHGAAIRPLTLAETGANRPIDDLLERDPLLARALLQEPRKVIVDRQCCSHADIMISMQLMSRHQDRWPRRLRGTLISGNSLAADVRCGIVLG